jgi:hypothetical protein
MDVKIGHCKIDNVPSFIRKIKKVSDTRVVICFIKGCDDSNICENINDFLKHKIEYPPYEKTIQHP